MADRDYFDLRYAIPGFTFLLIVFLINYKLIENITSPSLISIGDIFLGFLTLLSGSAIGFLITQIYFFLPQFKGRYSRHR
jgi:hypothetical protein